MVSKLMESGEEALRHLLKRYVEPTFAEETESAAGSHPALSLAESKLLKAGSGRALSTQRYSVHHSNQLYPSARESKRILLSNKETYNQVMTTLNCIEETKYTEQARNTNALRLKLRYFRSKAREKSQAPRSIS